MSPFMRQIVTTVCLALWAMDPWITAHSHQHTHVLADGVTTCSHSHAHSHCHGDHHESHAGHSHGGPAHCHHSHDATDSATDHDLANTAVPTDHSDHGPHDDCAACRHEANVACNSLYVLTWQVSLATEVLVLGEALPARQVVTHDYSSRGPPAFCA